MELTKEDMQVISRWPASRQRWIIGLVEGLKRLLDRDRANDKRRKKKRSRDK